MIDIDQEEVEEVVEDVSADLEKSFVVADIGSTNTSVILIDTVEGKYRLLARASVPTTAVAPWLDVSRGVQQAITRISEITGRNLLNERGMLIMPPRKDGSGVDHFAAVASAPTPLRAILVGLYDDMSIASARKALHRIYTEELDVISLADTRSEEEQVTMIIQQRPDLIFIAGGTDGGAEERLMRLVELTSIAVSVLSQTSPPQVIYAGNAALREKVRTLLEPYATVHIANNVRPNLKTEQLDDVMRISSALFEDIKIQNLPGVQEINDWTSYQMLPSGRSFAGICQYFASLNDERVLGVDLGSDSVTITMADSESIQIAIRTDFGIGEPVANLLKKISTEQIANWIPEEVEPDDIADYVLNKSIFPATIPLTETDLHLEQAVAREVLHCAMQETAVEWGLVQSGRQIHMPKFGMLLAHGSLFANAPRPGQVMLLLLDALQPTGTFSIALDQYGVLPPLGALAAEQPLVVVQTLSAGVLSMLGWVIAPAGKGQPGKKVLDIVIESEQTRFEGEIEYGKIEIFPIAPGQEAKITVKPSGRFDVGNGPGNNMSLTVEGGLVGGLVVDARGRPLTLPKDDADRRSLVRKWYWDLGG